MAKKKENNTSKNNQYDDITVIDTIASNLTRLMEIHNITGKELAEITHVAEPTISSYKNGKKHMPLEFLLQLKRQYGISIDDFVTKDITPADYDVPPATSALEDKELEDYTSFVGTYYLYYFDTSVYKGSDFNAPTRAMRFGILHIYANKNTIDKLSHSVVCITGLETRKDAIATRKRIEDAVNKDNTLTVADYIQSNYADSAYYGDFDMTPNHAFISMRHRDKDQALIILHRIVAKNMLYSGGIGTMNSVSRGRESMPALQFVGISRENTPLSDEELHQMLLLDRISIDDYSETNSLLERIEKLYLTTEGKLTDFQRDVSVKSEISAYVKKVVEWNLFRVAKISNKDDDSWYHKLKNSFAGNAL